MAENARLAADMDAERTKVTALQVNQLTRARDLAAARTQETNHRRELISQTDELEALRKWHARELLELEAESSRRERELHDINADLATTREDLERERKASASLREALAQQSAAQASLQSHNSELQAQLAALRAANDGTAETVSTLRVDFEAARCRIDELEAEAREAEMVRRRLHNMVQELKGNIRVFARVRPMLPSDVSGPDDEKARTAALANMSFPDSRDHREVVLCSTSESATGQERKEAWNFSFDRVKRSLDCLALCPYSDTPFRYLSPNPPRKRCLRKFRNLHRVALMVTMSVFLPMARLDLENLLRWKEDW
jgi:kinesin family protein C1